MATQTALLATPAKKSGNIMVEKAFCKINQQNYEEINTNQRCTKNGKTYTWLKSKNKNLDFSYRVLEGIGLFILTVCSCFTALKSDWVRCKWNEVFDGKEVKHKDISTNLEPNTKKINALDESKAKRLEKQKIDNLNTLETKELKKQETDSSDDLETEEMGTKSSDDLEIEEVGAGSSDGLETEELDSVLIRNSIKNLIIRGSDLPYGLLGEEHVNAMLYQELLVKSKREDTIILPMLTNDEMEIPKNFQQPKYTVLALSVNNNSHNTALIIDKETNTYTYLDSYGGKCPDQTLKKCIKKGLLKKGYKEKVFKNRTKQNDGWSCGLHVIENVSNFLSQKKPEWKKPTGNQLFGKYGPLFKAFSSVHGIERNNIYAKELGRRQKIALRNGLEIIIGENMEHGLSTLFYTLIAETDQGSGLGFFEEFSSRYAKINPHDTAGLYILSLFQNPKSKLHEMGFSENISESSDDAEFRANEIANWIRANTTE